MFADVGVFPRKGKMFDRFYLSIKNRVFPKTKSLIQVWLYAVKEVQISLKKLIFQFKDLNLTEMHEIQISFPIQKASLFWAAVSEKEPQSGI